MSPEVLNAFQLIFTTLLVSLITFIGWALNRNRYFKSLNVPFMSSTPFLGTFKDTLLGELSIYEPAMPSWEVDHTLASKPVLFITEPEIIKRIMVRDFQHFQNRHTTSHHKTDHIGYYNLFMIKNSLWKQLCARLTPFYATGKMFYLVDKINRNLINYIDTRVLKRKQPEIELKEMTACYTTDVIASCAFGVDAKSIENPDGEFGEANFRLLEVPARLWAVGVLHVARDGSHLQLQALLGKGQSVYQANVHVRAERAWKVGRKAERLDRRHAWD